MPFDKIWIGPRVKGLVFELKGHLSDLWYTTRDQASDISDDTTETEKMEILTILPSPSSTSSN